MIVIRVANAQQDATMLTHHNCAMALETENKVLDPKVAQLGVYGLFDRPQFGFYLVAEVDGEPAASLMVTYEWSDWRNGLFWWIESVYVKKDYRRQGLYRAMYAELKRMSAEQPTPVCGFRLYAETDNTDAHTTYRECGMHVCEYLMFEESTAQAG
ncbi:MAG: GNAT family N-acetyltransferase [Porticoccaceae bacterium]|jgi:GNAT superfamily N-acetyltransferase|nr:GNAT family N-acetyltransferase [Porticoccaceae bacterium]MDB9733603.1 GNAT family N-acetyltransferase [Porticoccaceae bacterium]